MLAVMPVGGGRQVQPLAEPRLVRAAHEFEAQMMKELIRPMTAHEGDGDEEGSGQCLSDFAGETLGQSLSRAGGFGIADAIIARVSQVEGAASKSSAKFQTNGLMSGGELPMRPLRRVAYGDSK